MAVRMRPVGWRYDSVRHSLAARGVSTRRRYDAIDPRIALVGKDSYTNGVKTFGWINKLPEGKAKTWLKTVKIAPKGSYMTPFFSKEGQLERIGAAGGNTALAATNMPLGLGNVGTIVKSGGKEGWLMSEKISLSPGAREGLKKAIGERGVGITESVISAPHDVALTAASFGTLGTSSAALRSGTTASQLGAAKNVLVVRGASAGVPANTARAIVAAQTAKAAGRVIPTNKIAVWTGGKLVPAVRVAPGLQRFADVGRAADIAIATKTAGVPVRAVNALVAKPASFIGKSTVVTPSFVVARGMYPESEWLGYGAPVAKSSMNVALPVSSPATVAQNPNALNELLARKAEGARYVNMNEGVYS